MNDNVNYAESCVKRKKDGPIRRKKLLLTLAYIFIPFAVIIMTFAVPILRPFFLLPLALTPLALSVIIPLTWCYTEIEYETILSTGILTVSYVYNRRRRKKMDSFKVGNATMLAPYDGEYKAKADAETDLIHDYDARSSKDAEGVYVMICINEKEEKCRLLFEPTDKMIGVLRFFNRGTVAVKVNK